MSQPEASRLRHVDFLALLDRDLVLDTWRPMFVVAILARKARLIQVRSKYIVAQPDIRHLGQLEGQNAARGRLLRPPSPFPLDRWSVILP